MAARGVSCRRRAAAVGGRSTVLTLPPSETKQHKTLQWTFFLRKIDCDVIYHQNELRGSWWNHFVFIFTGFWNEGEIKGSRFHHTCDVWMINVSVCGLCRGSQVLQDHQGSRAWLEKKGRRSVNGCAFKKKNRTSCGFYSNDLQMADFIGSTDN